MHPSRDTAGPSSPCVLQPGRAAGAPQPRRAIRANRVQTGGLPGLCSLLLEAWAVVHKIVVCPLISPLVLREGGRWCCRRRRCLRWICGVWSPLYASVRISIQRQKQTGRERERERERESESGGREGGVVEKERRRRRRRRRKRGWGNKSPWVRRSQWKKRGMREKGQEEKKRKKKKKARRGHHHTWTGDLPLLACECVCVCVCVCVYVCVCVCVCVCMYVCGDRQRGCEGGEAYVASVTRSVNKSRAQGLNRALFCLIQIPPESTFILLIK